MSSLIEKLISLDKNLVTNLPSKEVEIKRLSNLLGEKYKIKVQAISNDVLGDIKKRTNKIGKKGKMEVDVILQTNLVLAHGIIEPNLKDKKLLDHYGVHSSIELINRIFLPGEQEKISDVIAELSGMGEDDDIEDEIDEIKKQ